MSTLVNQALSQGATIGLYNGNPVTTIVCQTRSKCQYVGGILYVPNFACIRIESGDIVITWEVGVLTVRLPKPEAE